jgi:hypothetical protein
VTWHLLFIMVTVVGIYVVLTIVSHSWQERISSKSRLIRNETPQSATAGGIKRSTVSAAERITEGFRRGESEGVALSGEEATSPPCAGG